jgi:hypothetical protein
MKKALVSYQGYVGRIVDPGEEGPLYEGPDATFTWVDAPDNVQLDWTLEYSPQQGICVWVEREGPYTDNSVARKVAYGEPGAQLGMIFDAIKENGVLDTNSDWYQHQLLVKSMIPKPDPQPAPSSLEEYLAEQQNREPHPDKPCISQSIEMQAWKRYPGWKGYVADKLPVPGNACVGEDGFVYNKETGEKLELASAYGIVSETALDGTITWYGPDEMPVPKKSA